jgi:hypothetical protein
MITPIRLAPGRLALFLGALLFFWRGASIRRFTASGPSRTVDCSASGLCTVIPGTSLNPFSTTGGCS